MTRQDETTENPNTLVSKHGDYHVGYFFFWQWLWIGKRKNNEEEEGGGGWRRWSFLFLSSKRGVVVKEKQYKIRRICSCLKRRGRKEREMEFLQNLANSLKSARTVELPSGK